MSRWISFEDSLRMFYPKVDKKTLTKKDLEIILYCRPHLDKMWAAKIVSIILDCDFRDCELELKKRGY